METQGWKHAGVEVKASGKGAKGAVGSGVAPLPQKSRLKPPAALADFQRWFGHASARPLLTGNATVPHGVDGPSLAREANKKLNTVNGLSGLERLAVYNRQYWFRLITIMQEEYPCTLHVIGLDAFNRWAIRYIEAHPPSSPYLADMDAEFPAFLKRRFREAPASKAGGRKNPARETVLEAAAYDSALARAFDRPGAEAVLPGQAAEASQAMRARAVPPSAFKWLRSGHLTPVWLHYDFTAYRALCRADEALTGRFPLRRKGGTAGHGVCLHRHDETIYEKAISRAEFLLLDALGAPRTLDAMFRVATKAAAPRDIKAMERNVGAWFKEWTEMGWISSIKN